MLIPGGVLSGALVSWVLIAPAIPLCILLVRKPQFNTLSISVILLCVVSLLSGAFLLVSSQENQQEQGFHHFSIFLDFLFNLMVLQACTANKMIQTVILASGLAFCGFFLSLMFAKDSMQFQPILINIGYALLFVLSLMVIIAQFQDISRHLTSSPSFWVAAGIFFQFGLLTLLFFLSENLRSDQSTDENGFGLMFTIINFFRFVFFSIGLLLIPRKNGNSEPS